MCACGCYATAQFDCAASVFSIRGTSLWRPEALRLWRCCLLHVWVWFDLAREPQLAAVVVTIIIIAIAKITDGD